MVKKLLDYLNQLAFRLQRIYMRRRQTVEAVSLHQAFFHQHDNSLKILASYWWRLGLKIVLVTGCFDVLHQEHKRLLAAAKQQGDKLIVALETDGRVEQLKGSGRPINDLNRRLNQVAKLGLADLVIALPAKFHCPADYLKFLNLVKPAVLAVSDSSPNVKLKRKLLQQAGGQLKIVLKHNPRVSTTKILKRNRH